MASLSPQATTTGRLPTEAAGRVVARLFEEHGRMVYGVCRLMLRDRDEAEDAAQETFLAAHKSVLAGAVPEDPAAWLGAIARNECRSRIRARMRKPLVVLEGGETASAGAVEEIAGSRAEVRALCEALGELPAHQRDAVVLREFYGLSYEAVAAALGVSSAAVDSLLVRARKRLETELRDARLSAGAIALPVGLREALAQSVPGFASGGASLVAKAATIPLVAKLGATALTLAVAGGLAATAVPHGSATAQAASGPPTPSTEARNGVGSETPEPRRPSDVEPLLATALAVHDAGDPDHDPGPSHDGSGDGETTGGTHGGLGQSAPGPGAGDADDVWSGEDGGDHEGHDGSGSASSEDDSGGSGETDESEGPGDSGETDEPGETSSGSGGDGADTGGSDDTDSSGSSGDASLGDDPAVKVDSAADDG